MIQLQKETAYLPPSCSLLRETVVKILSQYNTTIQILLSTPHGGFSETSINIVQVIKNNNNNKKEYHKLIINKLLRNYLHINL